VKAERSLRRSHKDFEVVDGEELCAGAWRSIPEAVLRVSASFRVIRVKLRRREA
jgi:hypothetical protein